MVARVELFRDILFEMVESLRPLTHLPGYCGEMNRMQIGSHYIEEILVLKQALRDQ